MALYAYAERYLASKEQCSGTDMLLAGSQQECFYIALSQGMFTLPGRSQQPHTALIREQKDDRKQIFYICLFERPPALNHRQPFRSQHARNLLGLRTRSAEYNHIFVGVAARMLVANILHQPCQFADIVRCLCQRDRDIGMNETCRLILTRLLVRFQVFATKRLGHCYQIGPRAIVAAERQHLRARKILRELADIGGRSAPKSIDSLIRISHYPDALLLSCQFT